MAEILLKVEPGAGYDDGDVLCAFNRRRTRCAHAQSLCHVKRAGFTNEGLRPANSLARDLREACCSHRFERVSRHAIEKIDRDGNRQLLSGPEFDVSINGGPVIHVDYESITQYRDFRRRPDSQVAVLIACRDSGMVVFELDKQSRQLTVAGVPTPYSVVCTTPEHMDVEQWLRRRLRHERHGIFGERGAEFWFGGRTDFTNPALDKVWNAIQTKTPRRESEEEFQLWPMGRLDIRHHLAVRTVDFDDAEADGLVTPQYELDADGNPVEDENGQRKVLAKRNVSVNWRRDLLGDLGAREVDVLDRDKPIGREIVVQTRTLFRSKDQPEQASRAKLFSKAAGRPLE